MTDAEAKLWTLIRDNQFGVKFRRQFPIGKDILDFYCHKAMLNVEVDGGQHYTDEAIKDDEDRDERLQAAGIRVMRFSNSEVLEETETVVDEIYEVVSERTKSARAR